MPFVFDLIELRIREFQSLPKNIELIKHKIRQMILKDITYVIC